MENNMSQGDPLVSIRCLVYNHEPYLRQCLDGFVMQQTTFPFEAIVHDDASTDGSAAIIREYAEKYPHIIKPIYETENQYSKHDGSLTRALDAVMHPNSKYVALCEGDDYWTDPLKLQHQVYVLESHPECTIVFNGVKTISKDGTELGWTIPPENNSLPTGVITLDDYMLSEFYYGRWTFHTSTYLYRKSCVKLLRELNKTAFKNFPFGDQPILLSCLFQGKGYYLPDITGRYRVLSGGYNTGIKSDFRKEITFHEKRIIAWNDLDQYTSGKYHAYITRHCMRAKYAIMKLNYENGLMNGCSKIKFLMYDLWHIRKNFSRFKITVAEFLSLIRKW